MADESKAKEFKEQVEEKKDEARDLGEDPVETTEGKPRKDAKRKDGQDEEIPAWADSAKKLDAIMSRLDALEKKDSRPVEAADKKDSDEDKKDAKDSEESKKDAKRKDTEGDTDADTDREDRARKDAAQAITLRQQAAKIAEMEKRLNDVYSEPTIEDRNAIAEVRSRADSIYQALTGQTASAPIPGESPIAYRKRLVDGLRKFSDRMKDVRVDSLTGEAFAVVEDRIYTDALAATRSEAIVPAGTLRAITRNDNGHIRTDYIGDSAAWTAPFRAGAVRRLKFLNPKAVH